ncbi:MAG: hypothetical protein PHE53_09215 [Thermoguttaceae bacterium]|nr:hypothetical protein [Thermoguttaceae bacterium]
MIHHLYTTFFAILETNGHESLISIQLIGMLLFSTIPFLFSRHIPGFVATLLLMALSLWLHLFSTQTQVFTPPLICLAILPTGLCWIISYAPLLAHRPRFVSGIRSLFWMGLSLFGWVLVGPIELLFPASALSHNGSLPIGVSLVMVYILIFVLVALSRRPRFVIFHANAHTLLPALQTIVTRMEQASDKRLNDSSSDSESTSATTVPLSMSETSSVSNTRSDSLCNEMFVAIPRLRFHLWLESYPTHSQVTGYAADSQVDREYWNHFQRQLRLELPRLATLTEKSVHAEQYFSLGLLFTWFAGVSILADPAGMYASLQTFLRVWLATGN